ncbi:type II toxin-antitoxin system RelE/ParE family toxin, partial [Algoriphagus aestuarii]|nr:type II toxin-antitoxin system RelE/ParE family toxin [Algoriphagus aestuarii]
IKFTPIAVEDLDDIFSYIADKLHNKEAAINFLEKINYQIMRLQDFPFSGSLVSDKFLRDKGYRTVIVNNYIAFYLVNELEKHIVIVRILHNKQNY